MLPLFKTNSHYSNEIFSNLAHSLDFIEFKNTIDTTFALSGPKIQVIKEADLSGQIRTSNQIILDLENRYTAGIAVIYLQYFNPAFKGSSLEEAALKNHPRLKKYYKFASLTKGKEYKAGVLFVSKTFLSKNMGVLANRLRADTLYVALTRFRDELTIIYPKDCAIEEVLDMFRTVRVDDI